jgi:hypothetical protein
MLIASMTPQPIAVARRGNAANSASPMVGFAASSHPAAGRSAAADKSGDHCDVCSAIRPGSDTSAASGGARIRRRVTAHANSPNAVAVNSGSTQRIGSDATGTIGSIAVSG